MLRYDACAVKSDFCWHFFFFFTQVQTPVTLCSGELWSILVRLCIAHSADLRSRLRHVSSAPSVAYSTGCSRWSPIQVLTPLDGAWLWWSDGSRYVTAAWAWPTITSWRAPSHHCMIPDSSSSSSSQHCGLNRIRSALLEDWIIGQIIPQSGTTVPPEGKANAGEPDFSTVSVPQWFARTHFDLGKEYAFSYSWTASAALFDHCFAEHTGGSMTTNCTGEKQIWLSSVDSPRWCMQFFFHAGIKWFPKESFPFEKKATKSH